MIEQGNCRIEVGRPLALSLRSTVQVVVVSECGEVAPLVHDPQDDRCAARRHTWHEEDHMLTAVDRPQAQAQEITLRPIA